jgi:hypothetical protein
MSWKSSSILILEDCLFCHCWLFHHSWLFVNDRSHMTFAISASMVRTHHQVKAKQPQQHHQQEENPVTRKKKATPAKKKTSTP